MERAAAYALRRVLGLEVSPWAFHRLLEGEEPALLLGGRLSWAEEVRRSLIHWLEEAEGTCGEGVPTGSALEKALYFWEERLEVEEQERQQRSELEAASNETAKRHLRMERELLRLWRDPTAAIDELWQLREEDVGPALREQMSRLAPWDCVDREGKRLRLPWRLADVRNLEVRFQLAELGLGGVEKGALRPPGRLVAGIGLLTSLAFALVANGFREREPLDEQKAWFTEEQPGTCDAKTAKHAASGIEFLWLCGGEFMMGAGEADSDAWNEEKPAHPVRVNGFWMAKTETTNQQYQRLRPDKTGWSELPVASVSWSEARSYCQTLGDEFDLPTEAEWEYAARAGTTSRWSFGDDEAELEKYAWFAENFAGQSHPVATLAPNTWGLHDMHGNVWEWGRDCYDEDAYRTRLDASANGAPADNPGRESDNCQSADAFRVVRGGSFVSGPWRLRSAFRDGDWPGDRILDIGFRCVRRPGRQLDSSTP
ncbi:MAG: formylglycine-generating enzyme family protein [Thermoanaerobaculia bacterium]|nr:formylglycine-generating enzyme family protein [Thermoanaerobaculia bacterium]